MKRKLGLLVCASAGLAAPLAAAPSASFDYVSYRALDPAPETPPSHYRNPVLPGFQPDPSIVKVGEDFYLVTSTFSWFPGLPIYQSTDLVNWRLIGHAISRASQVDFSGLGTNRGLFAPAIEHHNGKFWIVNTCIECGGQFVITADKAVGPWSDPVFLSFGGIDPSLFFDDDGKAWIAYNDAAPGKEQYEGHRALWMHEFDPQAMRAVGKPILLRDGGVDITQKPTWAEGPHIYKHDGWYYLMAAEGGTAEQHSETIYRSRKVTGPYEPGPANPILTQRNMDITRLDRVEATGHADLVRLDDGSWWGVFLATRPFEGQSTLLGRETFLLPVDWVDGWPRFLKPGEAIAPVVKRPALPTSPGQAWWQWRDDFWAPLSGEWIGIRTPGARQQVALDRSAGALTLLPGAEAAGGFGKPAFVGRRLRHHRAEYTTRLSFTPEREGDFAGLLGFMDEHHFVAVGLEGADVVLRRRTAKEEPENGQVIARIVRPGTGPVELRLRFDEGTATSYVRATGGVWLTVGGTDIEPLASIHAGLFTGLVVGPYAVAGAVSAAPE